MLYRELHKIVISSLQFLITVFLFSNSGFSVLAEYKQEFCLLNIFLNLSLYIIYMPPKTESLSKHGRNSGLTSYVSIAIVLLYSYLFVPFEVARTLTNVIKLFQLSLVEEDLMCLIRPLVQVLAGKPGIPPLKLECRYIAYTLSVHTIIKHF